jgi:hypothetical protein
MTKTFYCEVIKTGEVYSAYYEVLIGTICANSKLSPKQAQAALDSLDEGEYLTLNGSERVFVEDVV